MTDPTPSLTSAASRKSPFEIPPKPRDETYEWLQTVSVQALRDERTRHLNLDIQKEAARLACKIVGELVLNEWVTAREAIRSAPKIHDIIYEWNKIK